MDFIDQAICAGRHKNAVAGISSVTSKDNTDGSVTFTILWKTGQTTKSTFKPPRGKGIKSTNIKKVTKKDANGKDVDEYHLIVTYDDNKTQDAGIIAGSGSGSASLTKDITANNTVGNTGPGYKFKQGMTFDEYVQAVHVAYIKPKVVSFTPASATYEIGTPINSINVQAVVQKESYDITSIELYLDSTLLLSDSSLTSGGTVSVVANPNTDNTNFSISCNVDDGTSVVTAKNNFKFVRYGFYGNDNSSVACSTSADVRGLSKNVSDPKSGTKFTVAAGFGDQRITIAVPAPLTIASAKYVEGMNAESKAIFTQTTVNVDGANGYTSVPYNVFTYIPLVAFSSSYTLDITLG